MLSVYCNKFQRKLLKAYGYCSEKPPTPHQPCFVCNAPTSLTWFSTRRGCVGWYYCSACGAHGDLIDFIAAAVKTKIDPYSRILERFFPQLKCSKQEYVDALVAYQTKKADRSQISDRAKFWAIRRYRQETAEFFALNRKKLRDKVFRKQASLFKNIAYVPIDRWDSCFSGACMPHAISAGHPMRVPGDRRPGRNLVRTYLDTVAREHPQTFYIRLDGRPGEALGCIFLRLIAGTWESEVVWASDTLRRGLAFGHNVCHPYNLRLQQCGEPLLLATDPVLALRLQAAYVLQLGVPPLMVLLPSKYLKIKETSPVEPERYPWLTRNLVVHGTDPQVVNKIAGAFQARAVCTHASIFDDDREIFERFPRSMLRTMLTGLLPREDAPLRHY